MKTDKNNISRLKELAKIVCLTLLLGACQNEDAPLGDPVLIKLDMKASGDASNRGGGSTDGSIASVHILQFHADGTAYGKLVHVAKGEALEVEGRYTATLRQSIGTADNYKLVILANLPSGISLSSQIGKTYADVQKSCFSAAATAPLAFGGSIPFPMFGVVNDGKPVQVVKNIVYSKVALVRAVARVDIGIGTNNLLTGGWDKGTIPFKMNQIQIWKTCQRFACLPELGRYVAENGGITIQKPSVAGVAVNATTIYGPAYVIGGYYCAGSIYLPEMQVWPEDGSGGVNDSNRTTRAAIIVGGFYNGSPTETFYRIDFTYDHPFEMLNLLRNNVYRFNIVNVSVDGYGTASEAYNATRRGLEFTASIDPWKPGATGAPAVQKESYLMYFGAQNGEITKAAQSLYPNSGLDLVKKSAFWTGESHGESIPVDYNAFYGEVPGNYDRPTAYPNGDIYPNEAKLLSVEGVYPALMISGDDITGVDGSAKVRWKDGAKLTAFDLCRDYRGFGYTDWRLPRASELLLMLFNRKAIEAQRGFTAFSGTYWSGSETSTYANAPIALNVWTVVFADNAPLPEMPVRAALKTDIRNSTGAITLTAIKHKIRCVRQVSGF